MSRPLQQLGRLLALLGVCGACLTLPGATVAQASIVLGRLSLEAAADFVALPLTTRKAVTPLVMLGLAIDEQAHRRAYDDLADLDGDGLIDTDYRNDHRYAGYFDDGLCYDHDGSRFRAASTASAHRCSGRWSGNFLNWLTMTRLDLIRHALYGGHRQVDSDSLTVLERADVPDDSHAWVKVYGGADLAQLMPAPAATVVKPVEAVSAKYYVIAGAFKGKKQANVLLAELTKKGFTKALIIPGDERSKKVKVAVDGFDNETDAYRASNELKKVIGEAGWVFKKK